MVRNFEIKLYDISVDFKRQTGETLPCTITFSQGDIGTSFINANLLNDGKIFNLTGYTVVVNVTKKDRTRVVTESEVIDVEKGKIEIPVSQEMLSVGMNHLEIMLSKEGTQMVSPIIPYRVVKTLLDGSDTEIPSQSEYPILLSLIKDVQDIKTAYETLDINSEDVTDIINMIN